LIENTDGFFLLQAIFSKIQYKHETNSGEFLLLHSDNFLAAQSEQKNNNYDFINQTGNKN